MKEIRDLKIVFSIAALISILVLSLGGCGHAETELGDVLGCTLAGNNCPSSDPNLVVTGPPGPAGPPGQIGIPGADALAVPVQFCPGVPEYASRFPEVGFCIGGHIYAVYSDLGGFLTLFPPGRYTSNAIGSRCNFSILANCEVVP